MEEYLTVEELSLRIKFEPKSIRNLVSSGKLIKNKHYVKPSRKKILFVWSEIEAWLYNPSPIKSSASNKLKIKDKCLLNI